MVREFVGQGEYAAFLKASVEAGSCISPGGGAMLLGVSRQRIREIAEEHPDVRAFVYRPGPGQRAREFDICVRDLVRYGIRNGRVRPSDFGMMLQDVRDECSAWASLVADECGVPVDAGQAS